MSNILSKDKVILNGTAQDKTEAIRMAGELLVKAGHVSADYVDKMLEREEIASTYMGADWRFLMVRKKPRAWWLRRGCRSFVFRRVLILAAMSRPLWLSGLPQRVATIWKF